MSDLQMIVHLYLIWKTRGYNGIRFIANWNLINRQKGRRIPYVGKMNLASNESLISIENGAICTGNLKALFEAVNCD